MLKYLINILLILLPFSVLAQNVKVDVKMKSATMDVGDQKYLSLQVEQGKNDIVRFPKIEKKIVDGVLVLSTLPIDTQMVGNKFKVEQKILITAFEDSIFAIPPFAFINKGDTLFTKKFMLSVQYPRLDSAEVAQIDTTQQLRIFDPPPPKNTPFSFEEFWVRFSWIVYLVIGLILLIILIRYIIKRVKNNQPIITKPAKPKEPAHVIAIRELDRLKAKKVWQSGKEKLYYSQLTDILKTYLDNRYDISTAELTSMELLDMLNRRQMFDNEVIAKFKQILSIADLAKFAKFKPLAAENDLCMKNSYEIVELTKVTNEEKTDNEPEKEVENEDASLSN